MSRPFDFHSVEWEQTFNHARASIEEAVKQLCSESCPEEKIPVLRGKIAALRSVIERDKEQFKKLQVNPFF